MCRQEYYVISYLKAVPLFSSLDMSELDIIYLHSSRMKYPKKKVIFLENEDGDKLYVILKGSVKIIKVSEAGEEIILAILREGEFFGDMSLLDGKPRSATVITNEDSQLLIIDRTNFEKMVLTYPKISLKIMRELTSRLRKADELIGSLAFINVNGRIASLLMQIAEERGEECEEGIFIKSRPTHQEIANMVISSRETVTRVLKQFEEKGFIRMSGKDITIINSEKFEYSI